MTNAIKVGKRAFTWSVVVMTIAWSMGVAALVPLTAHAADCPSLSAGDLFKVTGSSAVYLLNADMERMYFPHANVYNTWYADFAGVQEMPMSDDNGDACIDAYPSGGGVNFRPGSRLVKTVESPSVYAIGPDNTKHKLASATIAADLYGSGWGGLVYDLPPVFDSNMSVGSQITSSDLQDGMLVKTADSATIYTVDGGELYEVDGTLPSFMSGDVRTVSATVFATAADSGSTKTVASLTADPSQGGVVIGGEGEGEVEAGDMAVALAASTPASANIADGTAYNSILKINVTAGSTQVSLDGLTITRTGLIANSNVTGVSVWDAEGNRHGEVMSSFGSNNEVVIGFASDPILVAANSTETVTVKFNLGTSASGGTVGAKIASVDAINTDATVTGSFPIESNVMSVVDGASSLAAAQVEMQTVGGASASTGSANTEIGEIKDIAKVKITETTGINDIAVDRFVFYIEGTLGDDDVTDFELYSPTNELLGTADYAVDNYLTLVLDEPYTVEKSKNRTLTLKAKFVDGSAKWLRVQLQNDYDVLVKDKALGYYLIPDSDSTSGNAWTAGNYVGSTGYFILKSGSLTITKSSDSPSGQVSAGASDVVLAKFDVKAVGEDLEIRKMGVEIVSSTQGSYDLNGNVKLVMDGQTLLTFSGTYAATLYVDGSGSQRSLSQYVTIKSGETKVLEVIGNIDASASTGDDYTVQVGNFYAKRMSTKDFADNLPASTIATAANQVTVNATNLTFVKDTSYGNTTVSKSSTQLLGQYKLKAGTAEGICLTNLAITLAGYGTVSAPQDYTNLAVWFGDEQFGSTVTTVATSSNSFGSNKCLAANEEKTLYVKAYVNSTAGAGPVSTTIDANYTYVGASTGEVDSTNDAVIGQDITLGSANLLLTAVNDSTTVSSIRMPSTSAVQLGKWKLEAQNDTIGVSKITFQLRDHGYGDDTTAGNFGTMYLYDSTNMSTPLGTASYVAGTGNGYVQFVGFNLSVASNQSKYLVLQGTINGGSTLNAASKNVFVIKSDATTDMTASASSGGTLTTSQIDAVAGDDTTNSRFATSTWYLFHNVAPTIANYSLGTALESSATAKLFRFTITNNGDREMKLGTMTMNIASSGMTAASASTGTIGSWKLYEANTTGGLGTLLDATSTCELQGGADNSGCYYNSATGNSIDVEFGPATRNSGSWSDGYILIEPGSSRTFIATADTTAIFNGKTTGQVSVTAKFDGATGFSTTAGSDGDTYWSDGVIYYYYKQTAGGSYNSTYYTASDSYDVLGDTLKASL